MDARTRYISTWTGLFQKSHTLTPPPPVPRPENRLLAKAELHSIVKRKKLTVEMSLTIVIQYHEYLTLEHFPEQTLKGSHLQSSNVNERQGRVKQYEPLISLKLEAEEP
jgi:hypothetical protein